MSFRVVITFMVAGALSMLVMSVHYLYLDRTGIMIGKPITDHCWYRILLRGHIATGLLAMLLAPAVWGTSRRGIRLHRGLGYGYGCAVLFSAVIGLCIAPYSMGGWVTGLGFTMLSTIWLGTTVATYWAAVRGYRVNHVKLGMMSVSLTYSALTLRLMLLLPLLTEVDFMTVYRQAAWSSWLINLGVVLLIIKKVKLP